MIPIQNYLQPKYKPHSNGTKIQYLTLVVQSFNVSWNITNRAKNNNTKYIKSLPGKKNMQLALFSIFHDCIA